MSEKSWLKFRGSSYLVSRAAPCDSSSHQAFEPALLSTQDIQIPSVQHATTTRLVRLGSTHSFATGVSALHGIETSNSPPPGREVVSPPADVDEAITPVGDAMVAVFPPPAEEPKTTEPGSQGTTARGVQLQESPKDEVVGIERETPLKPPQPRTSLEVSPSLTVKESTAITSHTLIPSDKTDTSSAPKGRDLVQDDPQRSEDKSPPVKGAKDTKTPKDTAQKGGMGTTTRRIWARLEAQGEGKVSGTERAEATRPGNGYTGAGVQVRDTTVVSLQIHILMASQSQIPARCYALETLFLPEENQSHYMDIVAVHDYDETTEDWTSKGKDQRIEKIKMSGGLKPHDDSEKRRSDPALDTHRQDGGEEKEVILRGSEESTGVSGSNWLGDTNMLGKTLPGARILAFCYPKLINLKDTDQAEYIGKAASALLHKLEDTRQTGGDDDNDYDKVPIVFIGSGIGGLVVQKTISLAAKRETPSQEDPTSAMIGKSTEIEGRLKLAQIASVFFLDTPFPEDIESGDSKDFFPSNLNVRMCAMIGVMDTMKALWKGADVGSIWEEFCKSLSGHGQETRITWFYSTGRSNLSPKVRWSSAHPWISVL